VSIDDGLQALLQKTAIAQADQEPRSDFHDVLLKLKKDQSVEVGKRFQVSLAKHHYAIPAELCHKPSEFKDHILSGTPAGIGGSHAGHLVIRSEKRKGKGTQGGMMLKFFDNRHPASALLGQHNRIQTKAAQEIAQLRPGGFVVAMNNEDVLTAEAGSSRRISAIPAPTSDLILSLRISGYMNEAQRSNLTRHMRYPPSSRTSPSHPMLLT